MFEPFLFLQLRFLQSALFLLFVVFHDCIELIEDVLLCGRFSAAMIFILAFLLEFLLWLNLFFNSQQRTDAYFDLCFACKYFRFLFFGVIKVVIDELLQQTQLVFNYFFFFIQVEVLLLTF